MLLLVGKNGKVGLVISNKVSNLSELVDLVKKSFVVCGQTKIICIDGPAGSGKTTLAKSLSLYLNSCPIIHMDEIYEGWEDALGEQTTKNLMQWIVEPLNSSNKIVFYKYDWNKESRSEKIEIKAPEFLIIEGVGSAVPSVSIKACLKIWIEVAQSTGLNRVLKRDGVQIQTQMNQWQKIEKTFFLQNLTKENSDIWIDGDPEVKIDTSSQFVRTNR